MQEEKYANQFLNLFWEHKKGNVQKVSDAESENYTPTFPVTQVGVFFGQNTLDKMDSISSLTAY